MGKNNYFFNDKILVLRLKKGVQFAWAKSMCTPHKVFGKNENQ